MKFLKYPKTYHLEGSAGFDTKHKNCYPLNVLDGKYIVIEEKIDGANSAISFDSNGQLFLQSRGHYLNGGPRERFFSLFKQWANRWRNDLWNLLSDRYVVYGEYTFAKHTIFYNRLPSYFLEFDIFDKKDGYFLSTKKRQELLAGLNFIHSVPIIYSGKIEKPNEKFLTGLIKQSNYIDKSTFSSDFYNNAKGIGKSIEWALGTTDQSMKMEGLYVKIESNEVDGRFKYVRKGFLKVVFDNGDHWLDRPIIKNKLA